ncbi:hypothetical protein C8R43DRAFT_910496 [Mycena crocata]|nr:hypothetical protein C8R43DRAFT_910496 [Mycena crocata]
MSMLIWDWLLCLSQEWRYIWKSNGRITVKILYCLVRYYKLLWAISISCARYAQVTPVVAVVIPLAIEQVLALRVYALYGCDRKIGLFLVGLLAVFFGIMIAISILAFDYLRLPFWPGPCVLTGGSSTGVPHLIFAFFTAPMALDTTMTAMTVYRLMIESRNGGTSSLMTRMVRDNLFYFVAITSLNLLNVIFFLQANEWLKAINGRMSLQITSVLCCRLILSIRAQNDRSGNFRKFSSSRGRWVTDLFENTAVVQPRRVHTRPVLNANLDFTGAKGKSLASQHLILHETLQM